MALLGPACSVGQRKRGQCLAAFFLATGQDLGQVGTPSNLASALASAVLGSELSLMASMVSRDLVSAHMKLGRKSVAVEIK